MALLGEVRAIQADRRPGLRCSVATALETLGDEDAAELAVLLDDRSVFATVLSDALKRRGIAVPAETIQRHRRGVCACGR